MTQFKEGAEEHQDCLISVIQDVDTEKLSLKKLKKMVEPWQKTKMFRASPPPCLFCNFFEMPPM